MVDDEIVFLRHRALLSLLLLQQQRLPLPPHLLDLGPARSPFVLRELFRQPPGRVLGVPLLRFVIRVDDAKARRVALAPLEVVEDRPRRVRCQIHAVVQHGPLGRLDVALEIGDAEVVFEHRRQGRLVLPGAVAAALGDADLDLAQDLSGGGVAGAVGVGDVLEELAEAVVSLF